MNNLAVVFGTGPLGRATMNELVKRGEHVRMINRSGTLEQAPKNVEIVAADASNLESAIQASRDASVIFNCVGTAYTGQAWETQMPVLWSNILQAATSSKAKLVIGDNLYVYDQADESNIRCCIHAEQLAKFVHHEYADIRRDGRIACARDKFKLRIKFFSKY